MVAILNRAFPHSDAPERGIIMTYLETLQSLNRAFPHSDGVVRHVEIDKITCRCNPRIGLSFILTNKNE